MLTVVIFILVLAFLVFVHELGHYLVARKVGIRVLEFSIGFPPKVYSKVIGDTEYMLSLIPLGGYVKLHGQNIDDEDPKDKENYASKTITQRLAVLLGGPVMNLITALLLMPLVYFIGFSKPVSFNQSVPQIGKVAVGSIAESIDIQKNDLLLKVNGVEVSNWEEVQEQLGEFLDQDIELTLLRNENQLVRSFPGKQLYDQKGLGWSMKEVALIGTVLEDTPAARAGIQSGDQIISINGVQIEDWEQISTEIQKGTGEILLLQILRDSSTFDVSVKPAWNEEAKYWYLGINSRVHVSYGVGESIVLGTKQVVSLTSQTFQFLGTLVMGKADSDNLGGPIMIARVVGQAARQSPSDLIRMIAFISLQLAIFNLLPIPALDGGHIFFLLIEKIKGSTLSGKFREKTQVIGFSLLLLLMVYVSIQDGLRLFAS